MSLMSKIKHRTMPLVAASVVAAGSGNAGAQERPGAALDSGAGGQHVVDQNQPAAGTSSARIGGWRSSNSRTRSRVTASGGTGVSSIAHHLPPLPAA